MSSQVNDQVNDEGPPPAPARPVSAKEAWEGQIYTVRCDDGSGRTLRLRARRATPEEFRRADDWVNKHHP